jgi:DNA-binding transcriptional LysR family regulator
MGVAFDTRLLTGLGVLAAVVETGSFVRAAAVLGMSDSGVSRAVARLEARLGVRLLDRTTRSVRLTDAGRRFHGTAAPLLAGIEEAAAFAAGAAETARGRLRVDVDAFLARRSLAPALPRFLAENPELDVELLTRETTADLVGDGIDLALRFGPPMRPGAVAMKLMETRILTVAAPAYLFRRGHPSRPEQLSGHECIDFRDAATRQPFEWTFLRGREAVRVPPAGRLIVADVDTMLSACLAGAGIAQVMGFGVQPLLAAGHLVELFPDWPDETFPLFAVHPSRRHTPAKVRRFIAFCQGVLASEERAPPGTV